MIAFPTSELIINPDGRIYHLNLSPDELADTIITVGDPERVPLVSRHFDSIEIQRQHREFLVHTGVLNGQAITVLSTGMGTPNIDIVLNELDALVNIDFTTRQLKSELRSLDIIRIGTTGGLQPSLALGDYVVTSAAVAMDNLLDFYQRPINEFERNSQRVLGDFLHKHQLPLNPAVISADSDLLDVFMGECQIGMTATCPGFYAPQARQLRATMQYPQLLDVLANFDRLPQRILNFEMETSAIYGLGRVFNHRCVSTSLILAQRANNGFLNDPQTAIEAFIESMLGCISDKLL